jgi:molybdopterin-guanine dinucleotide biosynthesis protein A
MKVTGIILAGGKNSRIGTEKAFLQLKPKISLIQNTISLFKKIFPEIIIVTNSPLLYQKFGTKVVEDLLKDKGPLGGIFTGLSFSTCQHSFVIACDMPSPQIELIKYIASQPEEYEVVIPELKGKAESLFARYSKNALPVIFSHLLCNDLKIQHILKNLKVLKISSRKIKRFDPLFQSFFNLNTIEDLKKARKLFSRLKRINDS